MMMMPFPLPLLLSCYLRSFSDVDTAPVRDTLLYTFFLHAHLPIKDLLMSDSTASRP
jgi:hypothetical protein